jgi:hypothetical protein
MGEMASAGVSEKLMLGRVDGGVGRDAWGGRGFRWLERMGGGGVRWLG